ncbi:MAG: response regulator transcription factor [Dehalococcoidia bacterium]|nr:response regulator transcription factor [Dehalococcoidia bacterium]
MTSDVKQERKTVLIIEDEDNLLAPLTYNLEREGYRVVTATDGGEGLELAREESPNLVILDIMLPTMDGIQVCRVLRSESGVPILMLTAKGEELDKVLGLEMGADDYMTKPFSMRELIARVKAMLRRAELSPASADGGVITSGDLSIDVEARKVSLGGVSVKLKPKEFDLLTLFAGHPGKAFTRDDILDRIWGGKDNIDRRTVDVHVRWIRQKLGEGDGAPRRIITIRGHGYRFEG